MTAPLTLRDRWLAAMRASTTRAIGRECDYGMSEGDVDKFDPLGLLALTAAGQHHGAALHVWRSYAGEDGSNVPHRLAGFLALAAGFPPTKLYDLALLNDAGVSWEEMATWVEAQRA